MKLAIVVAGGASLGLGHCLRGATLARAAREQRDPSIEVEVFVRGDAAAVRAVERELASVPIAIRALDLRDPGFAACAALAADALIVDDPGEIAPLVDAARARGRACVVVDRVDFVDRCAATVVPSPEIVADARVRSGPDYCVVEPLARGLVPAAWPGTRDSVLVCFGGADPEACTERVVRSLRERVLAEKLELRIEVVVGPASALAERMRTRSALGSSVSLPTLPRIDWLVAPARDEVFAAMQRARIAVCAYGVAASELAALGVPALIATRTPHDAELVRALEARGVARHAGDVATVDPASLAEQVELALASDWPRESSMLGRSAFGDGRGAERIVALALALACARERRA